MKKRHPLGIILIILLSIAIAGCTQTTPEIVCKAPYMRSGDACCMDKNSNNVCDDNEEDFFVEPQYEKAPVQDMPDVIDRALNPDDYEVLEPEETEPEEPEPVEVKKVESPYTAAKPRLNPTQWTAENEYLRMEVTKIEQEVIPVVPRTRIDPDKELYLRKIYLTVKNKQRTDYVHPLLKIKVYDKFDMLINKELKCEGFDAFKVEGCKVLEGWESMDVVITIDEEMNRMDVEKTIDITLQDRGAAFSYSDLEIKNTVDLLTLPDIKYS